MRCPRCGYVSFDHNSTCPKCNKDISLEQAKMNLPAYMPNPPRLLDVLTGVSDDSPMDFDMVDNIDQGTPLDKEPDLDANDTGTIEMPEESIQEEGIGMDLEFESISESAPQEETVMYSEPPILDSLGDEAELDLGQLEEDASQANTATPPPLPKDEQDEVTLDLDNISDGEEELTKAVAQATGEIEALDLDLDEIVIDDNVDTKGRKPQKISDIDEAEMITMEINKKKMKGKREIEDIDLDEIDKLIFDEPNDK